VTRAGLRPVARQTRAYFAPVDRANGPTAIFDPSKDSGFELDAPSAPWIDLGWIENFKRTSTSQIEAMNGGTAGAVAAQARHGLGARVDFEFRDWGKLQMALAGGAEHMNVLATDASALFSRNLFNFLSAFWDKEAGKPVLDEEIGNAIRLTQGGKVVNEATAKALGIEPAAPSTPAAPAGGVA